jgi:glycosyltransferase involved in cell wall biosynthesis
MQSKTFRIAVVASRLASGGGKVVGEQIIKSIVRLCPSCEFLCVVPEAGEYEIPQRHGVKVLACPEQAIWQQMLWDHLQLGRQLREFQPDWVWSLGNYPVRCSYRQSVLLHDPHILFSNVRADAGLQSRLKKLVAGKVLQNRLRVPQKFYCQTDVIRMEFASRFDLRSEDIGLCPPGLEDSANSLVFAENDDSILECVVSKIASSRCTFFYPAKFYPHKNHRVILEAFKSHREELKDITVLWTIGNEKGSRARKLLNEVHEFGLEEQIVNLGGISRRSVFRIMHRVDALLMPTTLETFGLPFIEAMQCDKPIITADFGFTRAVCGEAALYMQDANDSAELKRLMIDLASSNKVRMKLVERGRERLSHMQSWDGVVLNVLEEEGLGRCAVRRHSLP